MVLTSLTKYRDFGLLLLRVALGLLIIRVYGWPHLAGGLVKWRSMGHAMQSLRISFAPAIWGFAAVFSESIGAGLFALGFLFRPACILLAFTMMMAALTQYKTGGLGDAAHPAGLLIIFFSMIFIGPGKYSVDKN